MICKHTSMKWTWISAIFPVGLNNIWLITNILETINGQGYVWRFHMSNLCEMLTRNHKIIWFGNQENAIDIPMFYVISLNLKRKLSFLAWRWVETLSYKDKPKTSERVIKEAYHQEGSRATPPGRFSRQKSNSYWEFMNCDRNSWLTQLIVLQRARFGSPEYTLLRIIDHWC